MTNLLGLPKIVRVGGPSPDSWSGSSGQRAACRRPPFYNLSATPVWPWHCTIIMILQRQFLKPFLFSLTLLLVAYSLYTKRETVGRHVRPQPPLLAPLGETPAVQKSTANTSHTKIHDLRDSVTRTLVVASTTEEDTRWITRNVLSESDPLLTAAVYVVDIPPETAMVNTVPANKGHEVMVYLTHIIDNYDNLSDITMFMHAHQYAWHNNDLLSSDSAQMLQHFSLAKVLRDGYVNMRCHLRPGCPAHLHPTVNVSDGGVPEASVIAEAWAQLFPESSSSSVTPDVLSQPCCGQFAVSRARLQAVPLATYGFWRDWLLNTALPDNLSGRVWEYVWQYVFGGVAEFCPEEHVCYCDVYGICFGGPTEYKLFGRLKIKMSMLEEELYDLGGSNRNMSARVRMDMWDVAADMDRMTRDALARGEDPRTRAEEVGRPWSEGDGF